MISRTITKVEEQKRHPGRRSIYLDGRYAFGVDEEIAARFDLREGKEVEEDLLQEALGSEEARRAKNYSLNLLTIRARGEQELKTKLKAKGYNPGVVDGVIQDLMRVGLVDDFLFATTWAKDRMSARPRGIRLLRQELKAKGIEPEIVERVLTALRSEIDVTKLALELARRKARALKGVEPKKASSRLYAFLARRGFEMDAIRSAVRSALDWGETDD